MEVENYDQIDLPDFDGLIEIYTLDGRMKLSVAHGYDSATVPLDPTTARRLAACLTKLADQVEEKA